MLKWSNLSGILTEPLNPRDLIFFIIFKNTRKVDVLQAVQPRFHVAKTTFKSSLNSHVYWDTLFFLSFLIDEIFHQYMFKNDETLPSPNVFAL